MALLSELSVSPVFGPPLDPRSIITSTHPLYLRHGLDREEGDHLAGGASCQADVSGCDVACIPTPQSHHPCAPRIGHCFQCPVFGFTDLLLGHLPTVLHVRANLPGMF